MVRKNFGNVPGSAALILPLLLIYSPLFSQIKFQSCADSLGISHGYGFGSSGGGVSFVDFNRDGWDDLTFASSANGSIHFYLNRNGSFERIAIPTLETQGEINQILWVDYDNDGDYDFLATGMEAVDLFENNGHLQFTKVTQQSGLPPTTKSVYGAVWGDVDRDGWLDLYVMEKETGFYFQAVSNHLYKNMAGNGFQEITISYQASDSAKAPFCAGFIDINLDLFPDLYIAQDRLQGNTLLLNQSGLKFEDISASSGSGYKMNGMSVATGDYNNDGWPDIYVTNTPEGNALFTNLQNLTFSEDARQMGVAVYETGWGANFADFNSDGWEDLFVCHFNQENKVFHNDRGTTFQPVVSSGLGAEQAVSFANAIGDLNNDGLPDVAVNNSGNGKSSFWLNRSNAGNWVKLNLEGTLSNRDAIGARAVLHSGSLHMTRFLYAGIGYLGQNTNRMFFGLDENTMIDSLTIFWPSGHKQTFSQLPVNQEISIYEQDSTIQLRPHIQPLAGSDSCGVGYLSAGVYPGNYRIVWQDGTENNPKEVRTPGSYFAIVIDANGTPHPSDTLEWPACNLITHIQKEPQAKMLLYPNPASDRVRIRLGPVYSSPFKPIIYNARGEPQKIPWWKLEKDEVEFLVSTLPSGWYWIKLAGANVSLPFLIIH